MDDIDRIPCDESNRALSNRVLALHTVCRKHYPKKLKFRFGDNAVVQDGNRSHLSFILESKRDILDVDLPTIFTGEGVAAASKDPQLLKMVKTFADQLAKETFTEHDSSIEQESRNLVSLIGQKAAEMYLV